MVSQPMAGVKEMIPNQSGIPLFPSFLFVMVLWPRFVGGRALPLRCLWEERDEHVPCHHCRGMSLLGTGLGRGGDKSWPLFHTCHEMFHVSIIPSVGWAQKSPTNAGVGTCRAGNLSRCGMLDTGVWWWDPAIPRVWQSSLPHLGQLGMKSQSRKNILIFPPL